MHFLFKNTFFLKILEKNLIFSEKYIFAKFRNFLKKLMNLKKQTIEKTNQKLKKYLRHWDSHVNDFTSTYIAIIAFITFLNNSNFVSLLKMKKFLQLGNIKENSEIQN